MLLNKTKHNTHHDTKKIAIIINMGLLGPVSFFFFFFKSVVLADIIYFFYTIYITFSTLCTTIVKEPLEVLTALLMTTSNINDGTHKKIN